MKLFRLLSCAALVTLCAPSIGHGQVDFLAPGERAPITRLPSCVAGGVVGACFDFESGPLNEWHLAEWAAESDGYVRGRVGLSSDHESRSGRSLRVEARLQPVGWSAVALELHADVSLSDYAGMLAEVLAPADTTLHLAARFVILAGPSWHWLETTESFPLEPGKWSFVEAPLEADAWHDPQGSGPVDERRWDTYLRDVHKIIVRIEANPDRAGGSADDLAVISIDNIWFPER